MGVFIGLTVVLFGFAAFQMGQALASTWRPVWHNVPYGLLLAFADQFLVMRCSSTTCLRSSDWALTSGCFSGIAVYIIAVALFAYRVTLARKMVQQYPWLYLRSGLLSWRERSGNDTAA